MDAYKIEALLCALEMKSLNRAAEKLHCTQSSLSQLMNSLEKELGVRILERTHQGICLTEQGKELLPFLMDMHRNYEILEIKARRIREGRERPVRIGSFSSIANLWLPDILKEFRKLHPALTFDLRVGTDAVRQWLLEGRIDIAFGDDRRLGDFHWIPIRKDPLEAVIPASFPMPSSSFLTMKELSSYPLLLAPMNGFDSYAGMLSDKKISVTCDDDYTLLSLVQKSLGATLMPRLSLFRCPDGVRCFPLQPEICRVLGIALPPHPRKAAEMLASFAKERLADNQ